MKLKEIEIGMKVVDQLGNEYIVEEFSNNKTMPISVKCTKFVESILVQKAGDVSFHKEGQSFYIYKSFKKARKDSCDVFCITVKSLKPILEKDYLTSDNVKLGMKVIDGIGNEYTVEDYVDDSVQLSRTFETSSVDGESCIMSMKTWILFYDENKAEKHLITTKNFLIIEG